MKQYKIKYQDKVFDASEYQCKIFDKIEYGSGNLIINACAGSSKTTTIVNCIDLINPDKKILFIAFNTDIVNNIKQRVGERDNTNITTFHSLGYSILKESYPELSNNSFNSEILNEYKYSNYLKLNINNLSNIDNKKLLKNKYNLYINNIINLINYSRYYLCFTKKEIKKIAEKYGIELLSDEVNVCRQMLIWGRENFKTEIDYTDMLWLPNVLNLTTKRHLYDFIFVDESQDTSVAEQGLIFKTFKRGARFICVGDVRQQINIWCGASEDAIQKFKEQPNTEELPLPISYRCPKKIVELAKQYAPEIMALPNAEDGEIRQEVSMYDPIDGDMVLCRTTAPLIDLHMNYLRVNKKSFLRGYDKIKENFISLIQSHNAKLIDKNCITSDGFFPKLYKSLFNKIEYVKKIHNLDDKESLTHPDVIRLYDDIEGLKVLSEGLSTVEELEKKINIVLNGKEKDGIQLSTVHKAKGLEANNVYILNKSLMPLRLAKKSWEVITEKNLIYVAITRAKKTLSFIKENNKWGPESAYFNIRGMKKTLDDIRVKINYNDKLNIKENDIKPRQKTITPTLTALSTNIAPQLNNPKQKVKGGLKMKNLLK